MYDTFFKGKKFFPKIRWSVKYKIVKYIFMKLILASRLKTIVLED